MRRMCIITHGRFAEGLRNSLEMFLGESQPYYTICAYTDDKVQPQTQIDDFLKTADADDTVVFLTDILGGSVNTVVMQYIQRPKTYVIAGVNFPLALQLAALPEDAAAEDYKKTAMSMQNSIQYVNDYTVEKDDGDE